LALLLVGGCGSPASTGTLDGTYACQPVSYRDVSCSPMYFSQPYTLSIAGTMVSVAGHFSCAATLTSPDQLSCDIAHFDPLCMATETFQVTRASDGTITAGVFEDGASSASCTKQ
jgi:hypothetical protein